MYFSLSWKKMPSFVSHLMGIIGVLHGYAPKFPVSANKSRSFFLWDHWEWTLVMGGLCCGNGGGGGILTKFKLMTWYTNNSSQSWEDVCKDESWKNRVCSWKVTSIETSIPFLPLRITQKIHLNYLGSSLDTYWLSWTKLSTPKYTSWNKKSSFGWKQNLIRCLIL